MTETASIVHNQDEHIAHHFNSAEQQSNASRLGMWIFLATEVLLFSGLFCIYAVYRGNHPDIFHYGHRFLDQNWGAINTTVLILSSFTMALAVRSAQIGDQRQLVLFLGLTLLLGVDFLGIKTIEYTHKIRENLVWGRQFMNDPHPAISSHPEGPLPSSQDGPNAVESPPVTTLQPGDKEKGRNLFRGTCASCHGQAGQGMPGLG